MDSNTAVCFIQKHFRGYLARKIYKKEIKSHEKKHGLSKLIESDNPSSISDENMKNSTKGLKQGEQLSDYDSFRFILEENKLENSFYKEITINMGSSPISPISAVSLVQNISSEKVPSTFNGKNNRKNLIIVTNHEVYPIITQSDVSVERPASDHSSKNHFENTPTFPLTNEQSRRNTNSSQAKEGNNLESKDCNHGHQLFLDVKPSKTTASSNQHSKQHSFDSSYNHDQQATQNNITESTDKKHTFIHRFNTFGETIYESTPNKTIETNQVKSVKSKTKSYDKGKIFRDAGEAKTGLFPSIKNPTFKALSKNNTLCQNPIRGKKKSIRIETKILYENTLYNPSMKKYETKTSLNKIVTTNSKIKRPINSEYEKHKSKSLNLKSESKSNPYSSEWSKEALKKHFNINLNINSVKSAIKIKAIKHPKAKSSINLKY